MEVGTKIHKVMPVWHLELHLSPVVVAASHMSEVLGSPSPSFSSDFWKKFELYVSVLTSVWLCMFVLCHVLEMD